jgi:hypothetical protein
MEGLTKEEQATNFDTCLHIQNVQHYMHILIKDMLDRIEEHDQSKLRHPEVEAFTENNHKLAGMTYGSAEFDACKKAMGPALAHHYANNRHHPEFYRKDEEWRPIVGFEGFYEVSNYGNIQSLDREINRENTGNFVKKGEAISQYVTPKGYCRVQLQRDGNYKNFMVHRLVAEAFLDNHKTEVNHKDGVKHNNRVSNLEWVTSSENLIHAYETGLKQPNIKYVVVCEELGLIAFGCAEMEKQLREKGYAKASASGIWRCINHGGKHLDLTFTGSVFERWMNSPVNDMNLVDLIEMFCDWKASSTRHNDGNIRKSIEINGNRFNLSPQLIKIFENTAELFD